jgi:hypothetical protein
MIKIKTFHPSMTSLLLMLYLSVLMFSCSSSDNNPTKVSDLESTEDSIPKKKVTKDFNRDEFIEEYDLNRIDTLKVGDVNGDGIKDFAYIQPLTFYVNNNKIDSQFVTINFSCSIPPIKHYNGFQGLIVNVGDLDGNNTEELLYYPSWYQSNWGGIHIYSYQNNRWVLFGSASINSTGIFEKEEFSEFLKTRVKKINNSSFELIQHSVNTYDGSVFDSTIVVKIK